MSPCLYKWKLLSFVTSCSHFALVCTIKDEASEAAVFCHCLLCSKALEASAELGALCWLLHMDFLAELRGIIFYLPLSACHFPTTYVPSTRSLIISRSVIHVPVAWARFKLRCSVEAGVWLKSHLRALFPSRCLMRAPPLSREPSSPTKSRPTWPLDHSHSSCQGTSLETVQSLKGSVKKYPLCYEVHRLRRTGSNVMSEYFNLY